jgi:hypothetical protein
MKEAAIFTHLDVCTGQKAPSPAKPAAFGYVDTTAWQLKTFKSD